MASAHMLYIVLPAFNEEGNVAQLLRDIGHTLRELMPMSNVVAVVIDDGSQDGTSALVKSLQTTLPSELTHFEIVLLTHVENKGLAEAIKTGLLYCIDSSSPGDIILTMDCDNSHTPGLIPRLARRVFEGYDVVIASRYVPGARIVGLSLGRRALSSIASAIFRTIFPIPGVRDYTCGFRAYRAELLKELFRLHPDTISETGFSVMIDILLKVYHFDSGLAFGEVPLLLRYDKKQGVSKMNVRRTTLQTLNLLFRRRLGVWTS
jgi:dolichol-phosphate mannosyltransferase